MRMMMRYWRSLPCGNLKLVSTDLSALAEVIMMLAGLSEVHLPPEMWWLQ
jgi:hypothetical protein